MKVIDVHHLAADEPKPGYRRMRVILEGDMTEVERTLVLEALHHRDTITTMGPLRIRIITDGE